MEKYDKDWDHKVSRHGRHRAVGQLQVGPLQAKGYTNHVARVTHEGIDFKDTDDTERFLHYHTRKYSNLGQLQKARRMKMISRKD